MTSEEREKISGMLLERMAKSSFTVSTTAYHDAEFIRRCKNFIATKPDEELLSLLLKGNPYVLSADK